MNGLVRAAGYCSEKSSDSSADQMSSAMRAKQRESNTFSRRNKIRAQVVTGCKTQRL